MAPSASRRYRTLVADDNEDAVTILALLLSQLGRDVRIAKDGAQAVAVAAIFQPEVALLDIGMPELDGHEACRRIRAQPGGDSMVLVAVSGVGAGRGQATLPERRLPASSREACGPRRPDCVVALTGADRIGSSRRLQEIVNAHVDRTPRLIHRRRRFRGRCTDDWNLRESNGRCNPCRHPRD